MPENTDFITDLYRLILTRKEELPAGSYTSCLFRRGRDVILKKVGEEAVEVILAARGGDAREVIAETADLVYHLLVMLAEQGIEPGEIEQELRRRFNQAGGNS